MTAQEAYQEYSKIEKEADEAYTQFWVQKFASANINNFELEFYTHPRRFNGVKIHVRRAGQWIRKLTIKSESGFAKFIRDITQTI